ncbi:hypothetical protein HCN44_005239 [Aphidius gifuensis]|uniref:Uncharacterized protein n=1 Tax=Aphidius gifuensis TaxID=684658 RepID=A0A834XSZ7_APHGI|nr:uncharacterized protein LOC122852311 [Aphidius gifuensis]KAF7992895.1 hypothetical protein HCN44_005239 [Aphidius gifuensis]
MATDVEESDTEDHERAVPSKRQCIQLIDDNKQQMIYQIAEQDDNHSETESEYDRNERLTLERWQACQVAKGFVDNTINRVMENYILGPQADPSQFRLFRGTEMENTAVMMAIKNHGLVSDSDDPTEFDTYIDDKNSSWSNNIIQQNHSNLDNKINDTNIPYATTSSDNIFTINTSSSIVNQDIIKDKIDDDNDNIGGVGGGDEQDFLERAVAEAIKIKGLGAARNFDYN